jgi:hypothetical protein
MPEKALIVGWRKSGKSGLFDKMLDSIVVGSPGIKIGGPMGLPAFIGKKLVPMMQDLPAPKNWVNYQMVVRPQAGKAHTYDFRVIDIWERDEKGKLVIVSDYAYLDTHPEIVKFEGWFNSRTHQVDVSVGPQAVKPPKPS